VLGDPVKMGVVGDMMFYKLFQKIIVMWPSKIDVSKKMAYENGGVTIQNLIKIHDEVEKKILAFDDNLLCQVDWAIYTVLHKLAQVQHEILIKDVDVDMVKKVFEENVQELE